MSRVHVFADEAGCLAFLRNGKASRYFIICTVLMRECSVGNDLLALRRTLAWQGAPLGKYFHASDDKQIVRDAVFETIRGHDFTVQATIMEKSKAHPTIRSTVSAFYGLGWYYHFRFGVSRLVPKTMDTLVTAAAIGTRKEQAAFSSAVDQVLGQTMARRLWRTDFPPAHSDPCVQVADYCAWAIQRRWETGDDRSYDLIKSRINYEYDLWSRGSIHFY